MGITISVIYKCGHIDIIAFLKVTDAAKYGESMAKNPPKNCVSILLKGPDGEREFIK